MGPEFDEPGYYEIVMTEEVFKKLYGSFFLPVGPKDQSDSMITIRPDIKSR